MKKQILIQFLCTLWLTTGNVYYMKHKIEYVSVFYEVHDKEIKCKVGLHDTVDIWRPTNETRMKIWKYARNKY